ncbi:hypothetical protein [Paenibacillus arenilitoris]|uniref:Lipoprotein n=1 Tax=Paenibacillus arenilitoris TaxID=2772299 RepID=A0A927H4V1_9BACL|nr:hypothetical protein [Paenibacillus arenilitoris]MBD2867767.1 hypothetical protein [Paenibacillus arenilitoris]
MNTSKRRRSKKTAAAGALLLAVMLAASACSGNGNGAANNVNEQPDSTNEGPVVDLPEQSGVIEPDVSGAEPTESPDNSGEATEEPANEPVISGEGTYSGMMDSHSIEIETADGAIALQIPEELSTTIDSIPADAKVKFEYTEKAVEGDAGLKQNWLVKIEEVK